MLLMSVGAVWAAGEPVLRLSPKLRAALVAEMAGLKEGTAELAAALKMHDSYILKQKLTRAELAELEHTLPRDFAEMDARFHQHAEALAHAAERRDAELSGFYFARMLDGCMSCHARYAAHALPGFAVSAPAPAHAH
jgi:cytochrome c556